MANDNKIFFAVTTFFIEKNRFLKIIFFIKIIKLFNFNENIND